MADTKGIAAGPREGSGGPRPSVADARPLYERPRALRLENASGGRGNCSSPGSGDATCDDGNSASGCAQGNSAVVQCTFNGIDAGSCILSGSTTGG